MMGPAEKRIDLKNDIYTKWDSAREKERKEKKPHLLHRGWNWRALYEMKARAQKEKYLFSLLNRGEKFDVMGIERRVIATGITVEIGREMEGNEMAFTKI